MYAITLTGPDDWHLHVRDGAALKSVVPHSASQFDRAIIMPNLRPPVTTVALALDYRRRVCAAVPGGIHFDPLMTLYLTDSTAPEEIQRVAEHSEVLACKLYPAGATTHSEAGIAHWEKIYPILEMMERFDVPLLIHGEITDREVDIFDRERLFIDRYLSPTANRFPSLRMVLEHITTQEAVQFISAAGPNLAATITAHHLLYNRNALFAGGLRPHYYCLPVLKREAHRQALIQAATSGNPKFFLGTDSAPHPQSQKESRCGCAGCYTAHAALELYAEVFDAAHALDKLEGFASFFGADFYRLPRNRSTVTLKKETWKIPTSYPFAEERVIPLKAGEKLSWKLVEKPTR